MYNLLFPNTYESYIGIIIGKWKLTNFPLTFIKHNKVELIVLCSLSLVPSAERERVGWETDLVCLSFDITLYLVAY